MLRLWMITSSLFVASFGVEVNFTSDKTCYSSGENMILTAVYTGSGTVTAVEWYYSNRTASNLLVLASNCLIAGGIDAGYPDTTRMSFNCSQATNTFTLTLTGLENDEFDKSWGATFSLSVGAKPDVVQSVITSCDKCTCDDCKCKKKCHWIVILSIVMGVLGILLLPGTRPIKGYFGRKPALVDDSIGILCGVTSFVLGIVVQAIDCCEYTADCCKDLDCCKDECKRNWIENTGVAFIVIGVLVGIAGGVIFYLLWTNRMGPGNNGNDGNATSTKSKKATSTRSRDATSTRSPKVQSQPEPQESLSSRANSDGEVSRKDVHVQEPKLRKLPMPPIQTSETHDKKGRGLSATFDDNHPLESVEIPERRAGDLEPMTEEPKKKKKRSKKAKETKVPDDDHEDKF